MNLAHDFPNPRDPPFVAAGGGHLTEARTGANVTAMSQFAFGYWYWYTARSVPVR
jgi:predicted fused transcriptional regulator/phosphomethylpyrimidine kinase